MNNQNLAQQATAATERAPQQYDAYGLHISSEAELLGTRPSTASHSSYDLIIRYGKTPETLNTAAPSLATHQVNGSQFLLNVKTVARYLVDGAEVIVEPEPGVPDEWVSVFLVNTILGVALWQRGYCLLHGSAVETEYGAALFIGPSGRGKSTLAAALAQRGFRVLSDDMCAIRFDTFGRPVIFPGLAELKLMRDAMTVLGLDHNEFKRVNFYKEKFFWSLNSSTVGSTPLRAIYAPLVSGSEQVRLEALSYQQRIQMLLQNVHRRYYLPDLGLEVSNFQQLSAIARQVAVKIVHRPQSLQALPQLITLIEQDLAMSSSQP